MAVVKNVAIVGGTGYLGRYLTAALIACGDFSVTLVSRSKNVSNIPAGVNHIVVDYQNPDELVSIFKGQDVVVSAVPGHFSDLQMLILNSSIAAGVPRFVPSEFGSNNRNPFVREMDFFECKVVVDDAVKKAAGEGKIAYTSIVGGGFVQWMLSDEHVMPIKDRKFIIHGNGDIPFTMTTLEAYGDALVGVLHHVEETKNRVVFVGSITTTQNHLLKLAKEAVSGDFKFEHVETKEEYAKAQDRFHTGEFNMDIVCGHVLMAVFSEGYGGVIEPVDNDLVGVESLTDDDLKQIIKSLA